MAENILPTITLAELYEAQQQLVDAVNIYAQLKQTKSSKEIEDKIQELTDIIFENINRDYADKISAIFSQEELRFFRIIPGQNVQISNRETALNEARWDIEPEKDDTYPDSDIPKSFIEEKAMKEEISVSGSELQEIEKRLREKPDIQLEELINDKDSLKNEREELLKKLAKVEEKIKDLAEKNS